MKELIITLHPDRYDLALRTDEDDKRLTIEVLEAAMRALQVARSKADPPVPPSIRRGDKVDVVTLPPWWVEPGFEGGSAILHRHPGSGWNGFSINPEQARQLAQALLDQNPLNSDLKQRKEASVN